MLNPTYHYQLASDVEAVNLLQDEFPLNFSEIYQENQIPASRADLARLIFLYWYGGFYVDLSFGMTQSLDRIFDLSGDCVFIRRDDIAKYKDSPLKAHRINGLFAVKAKSEFIYACLERAFDNLTRRKYNKIVTWATGPKMFNDVLKPFEDGLVINDYSFKTLLSNNTICYSRVKGVSNSWLTQQETGIMPG